MADLLEVASDFPSFPMLLETTRECLRDVFDVPALREVLTDVRSRKLRVVPVETRRASPFAQSLLFGWIAVYMYEGDAPLAERRAAALALDRDLLRDLMGAEELRELLDPAVLEQLELELQRLVATRQARHADDLHDLLVDLGPLTPDEVRARCPVDPQPGSSPCAPSDERSKSAGTSRPRRTRHVCATRSAGRSRQVFPAAFTDPVEHPLDDMVARYARTHVPFAIADVSTRLGVAHERVREALGRLDSDGRVVFGEFRPGGIEREWCDTNVLRVLRRRSLAALRHEIEPVDAPTFARFLPAWQGVGRGRRGMDALVEALEQLQGVAIPASVLERDVLPVRVDGYKPAMLDELCATGEIVWIGAGSLGSDDGRVRLYFRDRVRLLAPRPVPDDAPADELHDALRDRLLRAGASFWPDLVAAAGTADETRVLTALWDLVWAGEVDQRHLRAAAGTEARHQRPARRAPPPTTGAARAPGPARGRRPLVARCSPARTGALHPPSRRTQPRCSCSSGTAS